MIWVYIGLLNTYIIPHLLILTHTYGTSIGGALLVLFDIIGVIIPIILIMCCKKTQTDDVILQPIYNEKQIVFHEKIHIMVIDTHPQSEIL